VTTPASALSGIPDGLRNPLVSEFSQIVTNFSERRWSSAELSGGRFSEIVYTILEGHARGVYATSPSKPSNFVDACRSLEKNSGEPRSFQILIPRLLPGLYEIRNNRNVGHVGGDVDPDYMDSSAVMAITSWILAELIRVFHGISTEEAQRIVNGLAERKLPLIWKSGNMRRVLKSVLPLRDQILLLLASHSGKVGFDDLLKWTDYKDKAWFKKSLRKLHKERLLEFTESLPSNIELLPPGVEIANELIAKHG
jgi:hypothetical protein